MGTTRVTQHVKAPREAVYRALLDEGSVTQWRVPDGMVGEVHAFEPRVGGRVHISLTYEDPMRTGKTVAQTDTYRGRFVELVPNERVVEVVEFETEDAAMGGAMKITITLSDADGGTEVEAVHEGVPAGVREEDNEAGWRGGLEKLAALVERR